MIDLILPYMNPISSLMSEVKFFSSIRGNQFRAPCAMCHS